MFLQSYVLPVCSYSVDLGGAQIEELFGTAFFINSRGVFLTAKHVLETATAVSSSKGHKVGVVTKDKSGTDPKSMISPIGNTETAQPPFDVAIGTCSFSGKTTLALEQYDVREWQDVATYGYPLNAVSGPAEGLNLNLRCHKGYVQRLLKPGDVPFGPNPPSFELSFLLSRGLSGAPVFIHRQPDDVVIGVCVGSVRSEVIEDTHVEVLASGKEYKEVQLKIDEYGLAHDIRPLLPWTPKMLNGLTLHEASKL